MTLNFLNPESSWQGNLYTFHAYWEVHAGLATVNMSGSRVKAADAEEGEQPDLVMDLDDPDSVDIQSEVESEPEKDETELELEKLVFGDSVGFRERLKGFSQRDIKEGEDGREDTGLEGLDDADVGQALDIVANLRNVADV